MIEKQYIDLFTQNRKLIDSKSAKIINDRRDAAFASFQNLGFPDKSEEDTQYSDIAKQFEPDFGLNLNRMAISVNPYTAYKCNVPELSTNLYFLLNDVLCKDYQPELAYPKSVFVGSLKDFAEQQPEVCAQYYDKITEPEKNGVVAFNTMFAQDGFVVYIPDNTVVEQPIQLINILTGNIDYLVNRRILIIAGKNSQVKVLTCDHAVTESKFLATQVAEIYADENAHVDFYELEENSNKVTRLASTFVMQGKSASVLANNITINCGFTRNSYNVKLNGENAEAYVAGIVIAGKEQHVDNFVFMDHLKPHCTSTQLFKYVLQEQSTGVFCGRIKVEKDAQKTMAYQTNNNLCASSDARMYSKPQLEIYADDVKCSHGLTTGQLDEEALFYLRARGIQKEDAKLLLMQAFTNEVLKLIRLDVLKERLEEIVERRFKGEEVSCGGCAICR